MIHSDNFTPFFGVVESVDDPLKNGRYQVRVYGFNTANKGILPTENLKWFQSVISNSAAMGGLGQSPTGFKVGTFVLGNYIDADKQDGIILGAINGLSGGVNDVSSIARGEGGAYVAALKGSLATGIPDARGDSWSEPATAYAAQYPKNQVYQSESGHVIEYDDTPGAERITIFHKSGSFEEFHPNGTKVEHNVGESFSIHLGGHNIFVSGSLNLVASGDYRVSVGGEMYVKAKNVVFDTAQVDIYGISSANDHLSSTVSGAYHVHPGVQNGNGVTAPPNLAVTAFTPSPANSFNISAEDTGYTPEVIAFGLKEGFLTPEDVVEIETAVATVDSVDETPKVDKKPVITDCGLAIDESGKVDYTTQLSDTITLRDVSIGAIVTQDGIRPQRGLTNENIICNLKHLAENVLEPLKAKYPNVMFTSAFRHGSGTSQHELGEACDVQFKNVTNSFYFEAAQWIKANLPHDQLLLEFKSFGSRLPWLHISLSKSKTPRYQVMTFFNHKKHSNGLVKLA